jgi:4-diphosphocytidyl-2-C-methyl-D-erythritol kinase
LIVTETARAKVNLALHVLGRRSDGYHELDSLVAFADIGDVLRFAPAEHFQLVIDGPFAPGLDTGESNLVLKAARAFERQWPQLTVPATIRLTKNLPVASGIGGGSADAAATLRGLLRLSGAVPDPGELDRLALGIGADVPVCLRQTACRMRGIGDSISLLTDFPGYPALLVTPGEPVATAAVFQRLGLEPGQSHAAAIVDADGFAGWRNDLEPAALALAPVIADVLDRLRRSRGIRHAAMSGSGATCYGLFGSRQEAARAAQDLPAAWWHAVVELA